METRSLQVNEGARTGDVGGRSGAQPRLTVAPPGAAPAEGWWRLFHAALAGRETGGLWASQSDGEEELVMFALEPPLKLTGVTT